MDNVCAVSVITVREVLDLPPIERGLPEVQAGSSGLDRVVRWVHIAEDPEIAHLLLGGELLLTIGMGIADSRELQQHFVNAVADVGVAGLVVELGHGFVELPRHMIDTAERRGLPLIALHREVAFVQVTETVHRAIISRQQEALTKAEQMGAELTRLLLAGADLHRILSYVAGALHAVVVLENPAHQVVNAGGKEPGEPGTAMPMASWAQHSRVEHEQVRPGGVQRQGSDPECLWSDLWIREQHWGRLHVIGSSAATELAVDRVAASIALALLSDANSARLVERARSALIEEIMSDQHAPSVDFVHRARSLGTDLTEGRLVVLVAEPFDDLETPMTLIGRAPNEADRLETRIVAADALRSAAEERRCAALAGLRGRQIVVVLAVPGKRPLSTVLEAIVRTAGDRLPAQQSTKSVALVAGASREATAGSLRVAIEEATSALLLGRRQGARGHVYHYSDLGVHQLLTRLANGPDLALFVESELRALLEHDSRARQPLLPTLRVYLSEGGRKSNAVRALGIQRRSLYLRLGRIQQILQRDLDDAFTRTRLTIAIQGFDLLEELNRRRLLT